MDEFGHILFWVEQVGIIAFSISGAMIAIEQEVDLFGVLFLGLITALGGGTLRDTLLGVVPSSNFFNYTGISLALFTAMGVFIIAYTHREYYYSHTEQIERITNVADSLGLGLFSVYGVQVTLDAGYADNYFLLIFMGMLTGVGGGLTRDIIVKKVPIIISKRIYAVASILGGTCYLFFIRNGAEEITSVIVSVLFVFSIRMLATYKKLNLPKVKKAKVC